MKSEIKTKLIDSYRFTSESEPTDEQLRLLMKEVGNDVRKRAESAKKRFQIELQQLCSIKINQPIK